MKRIALAILVTVASSQAWAAFKTGNDLLSWCEATSASESGACFGYLVSVADTHDTMVDARAATPSFCVPNGVTGQQLQKVVVKYMSEHPEELHNPASAVVLNALHHAFICPE